MFSRKQVVWLIILAVLAAAGLWAGIRWDLFEALKHFLENRGSTALFIVLMMILPIIGVPISLFLILVGIRFGVLGGIVVMLLIMPFHMVISYFLARRFLEGWIRRFLRDRSYKLPRFPKERMIPYSIIFVAVPGLPYAAKNYMLPLLDVPFRHYLWISVAVEALLGLPLVGVGGAAAGMDPKLAGLFITLFVALYFLIRWLKKRYKSVVDPLDKK